MIGKISEELPRHEVLAKTAAYEIRKYAPCVVAETNYVSKGMMDQGGSSPFMQLAKFIGVMATPENEGAAPIAMTAPVLMSHAPAAPPGTGDGDVAYKMAFFLPASRFSTAADVPAPTSPQVSIADVPARTVAVVRFSGTMKAASIGEREARLREALQADGVQTAEGAEAMAAGYNPPWTPPWWKTNEVMLEVTGY